MRWDISIILLTEMSIFINQMYVVGLNSNNQKCMSIDNIAWAWNFISYENEIQLILYISIVQLYGYQHKTDMEDTDYIISLKELFLAYHIKGTWNTINTLTLSCWVADRYY